MRWLAALLVLLAALVAVLLFTTDAGETTAPLARPDPPRAAEFAPVALEAARDARVADDAHVTERTSAAPAARVAPPVAAAPSIAGRVRRADGRPAERVLVGLFAPAEVDDGPSSPFADVFPAPIETRALLRTVKSWTRADERGAFEFEDPEPGTWIVRAEDGPLLAAATAPLVLAARASRTDVVIDLPPEAWLEGRVILPEGSAMTSLALELRANAEFSIARWMPDASTTVDAVRAVTDDALAFRLGPVETGPFTVGLVIDRDLDRRGRPDPVAGYVTPQFDVHLPAGVTRRDVDLRGGMPGSIGIKVDLGAFRPTPATTPRRAKRFDLRVWALTSVGASRADAVEVRANHAVWAEIGPLAPGEWQLFAELPTEGSWPWLVADAVVVESGARTAIEVALPAARHVLTLLDPQGGLMQGLVEIGGKPAGEYFAVPYPVKDGVLSLVLPPGAYAITARTGGIETLEGDASAVARFTWDAGGPRPATLRVPR